MSDTRGSPSWLSRRRETASVLVEALLRLGGGLDVPGQERRPEALGNLLGQYGLAGTRLPFTSSGRSSTMAALTAVVRSEVAT